MKSWIQGATLGGLLVGAAFGLALYWEARGLPTVGEIQQRVRDLKESRGPKNWNSLAEISPKLRMAVVASEDTSFYHHHGLDSEGIRAALLDDARSLRFRRGGSTITQQMAKNVFLGPERTMRRKFREAILARRIERALSKDEILEVYLNVADWGDGVTGAAAAAHFYFGKRVGELSWPEAALLAATLSNPHRITPAKDPAETLKLREIVLARLLSEKNITLEEYQQATRSPLI